MLGKYHAREKFVVFMLLLVFAIIGLIIIYLLTTTDIMAHDESQLSIASKLVFVKDNVRVRASDGTEQIVNLPKKFNYNFSYSYDFVPQPVGQDKKTVMYVKGSYHIFKLTYRDQLIYQNDMMDTALYRSGGDYIRMVAIPDQYIGKVLTITFTPLQSSGYGILVPFVIMGTQSDLILYSYAEDLDVLLIAAILLVFSLESFLILSISAYNKKVHLRSFLVPLYALILGLYTIVRIPAVYYFFPKGPFIYVLDYLLFLLLPISVGYFILSVAKRDAKNKLSHRIIQFLFALYSVMIIAQIALSYLGYIEFNQFQKLSQIFVVLAAVVTIIIPFTIEVFEYKRIISIAMALLMGILIFMLVVYLKTYRIRYLTLLGSVGGLFIVFQGMVVMKIYAKNYAVRYKVDLNKRLAFTDNLTRIMNRNAFENDMKDVIKRGHEMMFMIIDINNLKQINDKFGHNTGDYIIKSVAEMLNKVKLSFNKTTPYRIGGDEFVVVALDVDRA